MRQQHLAVGRQPIAPLAADEERAPGRPLQRQHPTADGRGAEAGPIGSATEPAFGRHMQEKSEVVPTGVIHGSLLILMSGGRPSFVDENRVSYTRLPLSPAAA